MSHRDKSVSLTKSSSIKRASASVPATKDGSHDPTVTTGNNGNNANNSNNSNNNKNNSNSPNNVKKEPIGHVQLRYHGYMITSTSSATHVFDTNQQITPIPPATGNVGIRRDVRTLLCDHIRFPPKRVSKRSRAMARNSNGSATSRASGIPAMGNDDIDIDMDIESKLDLNTNLSDSDADREDGDHEEAVEPAGKHDIEYIVQVHEFGARLVKLEDLSFVSEYDNFRVEGIQIVDSYVSSPHVLLHLSNGLLQILTLSLDDGEVFFAPEEASLKREPKMGSKETHRRKVEYIKRRCCNMTLENYNKLCAEIEAFIKDAHDQTDGDDEMLAELMQKEPLIAHIKREMLKPADDDESEAESDVSDEFDNLGVVGVNGVNGANGANGVKGVKGVKGKRGKEEMSDSEESDGKGDDEDIAIANAAISKLNRRSSTGWGDEDIGAKRRKSLFNMGLEVEVILLRLFEDIDQLLKQGTERKLKEMITADYDIGRVRACFMYKHVHKNDHFHCQSLETLMKQWEKVQKHHCSRNALFFKQILGKAFHHEKMTLEQIARAKLEAKQKADTNLLKIPKIDRETANTPGLPLDPTDASAPNGPNANDPFATSANDGNDGINEVTLEEEKLRQMLFSSFDADPSDVLPRDESSASAPATALPSDEISGEGGKQTKLEPIRSEESPRGNLFVFVVRECGRLEIYLVQNRNNSNAAGSSGSEEKLRWDLVFACSELNMGHSNLCNNLIYDESLHMILSKHLNKRKHILDFIEVQKERLMSEEYQHTGLAQEYYCDELIPLQLKDELWCQSFNVFENNYQSNNNIYKYNLHYQEQAAQRQELLINEIFVSTILPWLHTPYLFVCLNNGDILIYQMYEFFEAGFNLLKRIGEKVYYNPTASKRDESESLSPSPAHSHGSSGASSSRVHSRVKGKKKISEMEILPVRLRRVETPAIFRSLWYNRDELRPKSSRDGASSATSGKGANGGNDANKSKKEKKKHQSERRDLINIDPKAPLEPCEKRMFLMKNINGVLTGLFVTGQHPCVITCERGFLHFHDLSVELASSSIRYFTKFIHLNVRNIDTMDGMIEADSPSSALTALSGKLPHLLMVSNYEGFIWYDDNYGLNIATVPRAVANICYHSKFHLPRRDLVSTNNEDRANSDDEKDASEAAADDKDDDSVQIIEHKAADPEDPSAGIGSNNSKLFENIDIIESRRSRSDAFGQVRIHYDGRYPCAKMNINCSVHDMIRHEKSGCYLLAVSRRVAVMGSELPSKRSIKPYESIYECWVWNPHRSRMDDRLGGFCIEQDSELGGNDVLYERILCMKQGIIREMDPKHIGVFKQKAPRRNVVIIGTGTNEGEGHSSVGRIVMLEIIPEWDDDDNIHINAKNGSKHAARSGVDAEDQLPSLYEQTCQIEAALIAPELREPQLRDVSGMQYKQRFVPANAPGVVTDSDRIDKERLCLHRRFNEFERSSVLFREHNLNRKLRYKTNVLFARKERAPVTAVAIMDGLIVAAIGPKLLLFRWNSSQLIGIAFLDTRVHCLDVLSLKNEYLVLADLFQGLDLVHWEPGIAAMVPMARDAYFRSVYSVHWLINASNDVRVARGKVKKQNGGRHRKNKFRDQQDTSSDSDASDSSQDDDVAELDANKAEFTAVVSDLNQNLQIVYYAPSAGSSLKDQKTLKTHTNFYVGTNISASVTLRTRFDQFGAVIKRLRETRDEMVLERIGKPGLGWNARDQVDAQDKLESKEIDRKFRRMSETYINSWHKRYFNEMACVDGSVVLLLPMPQPSHDKSMMFRRLFSLYLQMIFFIEHYGACNPKDYRFNTSYNNSVTVNNMGGGSLGYIVNNDSDRRGDNNNNNKHNNNNNNNNMKDKPDGKKNGKKEKEEVFGKGVFVNHCKVNRHIAYSKIVRGSDGNTSNKNHIMYNVSNLMTHVDSPFSDVRDNIIDGDLIEMYLNLDYRTQLKLAKNIGTHPSVIIDHLLQILYATSWH